MLAEAVKEDLRMLRERLAQCSAESVRHKELLRCLGKKQQELREAMEELRRENCDVARCFRNNRQELQELEGLVAQTKEHFQMENGEAGVSVEEAQKVEGRRRPVLTGSGRGVPVLGPCSPAAAAVVWLGRTFPLGLDGIRDGGLGPLDWEGGAG
ncbi:uncharacterized protein LOC129198059 isoform X3 [Grus americana]|uniref:uncharacterized protein LOC129198059 isoform X3 n=1 Tax=Grus americana TaxID=9117 RepID=UPI0024078760|nr:uncharacterized protein LOC129198059 isoform X3 [Grus americana]XP_054663051.1 uncharacterized protein LOC129198059 isoform X3 [Grus americana]